MGRHDDVGMEYMGHTHALAPVAGTANDDADMRRMNKLQELNRVYSRLTLVGYGVMLGLTWPFSLFTLTLALTDGGPAGAIWTFVAVACGMFTVVCSMAELASLEPTAGGQYHWVSVFAPHKWRKFASYMVGWMCALGWQSLVPGPANVAGSTITAFGYVASPNSYLPKDWHIVCVTIAICSLAVFVNTILSGKLPGVEALVFTLYILEFFALFIVLFSMGNRSDAETVFTDFQDNAGWGSIGTACFVGAAGPVITLMGADSAVHLAEELKDASRQLPKAMITTALVNYAVGFLMLLAMLWVVGDVEEVLATPTGQPWVQVVWNATQSRSATLILVFFIFLFLVICSINANITSSRQLFAFARDGGLPGSRWISHVNTRKHVPVNAIILTWFIGCCLGLLPLGSSAAFINIQTIGTAGLETSYIICIFSRLHNRNFGSKYGNLGQKSPFYLGKTLGNIVNIVAILFLTTVLVAGCFPSEPNPTVETMNWSALALGITIIIAIFFYFVRGHKYLGPEIMRPVEEIPVVNPGKTGAFDHSQELKQ